jgi:hypothetical protein
MYCKLKVSTSATHLLEMGKSSEAGTCISFTPYHLHLRDDSKTLHIQRLERNSKQHHQLGVSNPHCYRSSKHKPSIYATVTCLISRWHQRALISAHPACFFSTVSLNPARFFQGLIASCLFSARSHHLSCTFPALLLL